MSKSDESDSACKAIIILVNFYFAFIVIAAGLYLSFHPIQLVPESDGEQKPEPESREAESTPSQDELELLQNLMPRFGNITNECSSVQELKLTDLVGHWRLAAYNEAVDTVQDIEFAPIAQEPRAKSSPDHLSSIVTLPDGFKEEFIVSRLMSVLLFVVDPNTFIAGPPSEEIPEEVTVGLVVVLAFKPDRLLTFFYAEKHSKDKYDWMDWSVYVRLPSSKYDIPQPLTDVELAEAQQAIRCFGQKNDMFDDNDTLSKTLFYPTM